MERRDFIGALALGGAGAVLPGTPAQARALRRAGRPEPEATAEPAGWQHLHADLQTDLAGAEHFFLGNGEIVAVVRHATGAALAAGQTPLALMLWDPEGFARTWSTYTFHPEWGLRRGMVGIVVDGTGYATDAASLAVTREVVDGVPVVVAQWNAGPHRVAERTWIAADAPVLFREVTVTNGAAVPAAVSVSTTLYYNHALFTDYRTDHAAGVLRADGYAHVELTAEPAPTLADRYLSVDLGRLAPGGEATARLTYAIRGSVAEAAATPRAAHWAAAVAAVQGRADVQTGEAALDHLFASARDGLRAAVSRSGRFDASVFQYNMEWVMDSTGVLAAASMTGQHALAGAVLGGIL